MARKGRENLQASIEEIADKSNLMTYGTSNTLEKETERIKNIVRTTVNTTNLKYGERADGRVLNYFNEINASKVYEEIKNGTKDNKEKPEDNFKDFMEKDNSGLAELLLGEEKSRILTYSNYRAIYEHIPECAQALDIYKNNIISPDDFTKLVFNLKYDDEKNEDLRERVENQLDKIREKYQVEDLADEIITETLLYGDEYVAVLSIDKELGRMLDDPVMKGNILNEENIGFFDETRVSNVIVPSDITDKNLLETFNELIENPEKKEKLKTEDWQNTIAKLINENVIVGSKKEYLVEKMDAELSQDKSEISKDLLAKGVHKKEKKSKSLNLSGSSIKILDPSKVVELKVDNMCYGYFVFEDSPGEILNSNGPSAGLEAGPQPSMNVNTIYTPSVNNTKFSVDIDSVSSTNVGSAKMELISNVFLKALGKKLDKNFIRKNKDMKEFLFQLIKQDYILKKKIKVTFLEPEEVVAFKVPPVFRKITLFAKLYLATLTNNIIVNLGRAHDKRVFYVETGLDGNYANAINRVIADVKTKEFKMSSIGDINSILNLSPGRFDDYYIPSLNGNRPIDIETIPGMNAEMNNEFLEYLRKSMLNGTGVTMAMIDSTSEVDYARQVSTTNAMFARSVIVYQKKFTAPFSKLMQIVYKNELKSDNEIFKQLDISRIKVQFPSPAALAMTSLTEQIASAEQNADFISNTLVPQTVSGERELEKQELKAEIIQDLLPSIDWEKYKDIRAKLTKEKSTPVYVPPDPPPETF